MNVYVLSSFCQSYGALTLPDGIQIETYNNMARYNLIDTKYRQVVFQSPSNGAPISPYQQSFGTPGQTNVSGDRQRETTHEICCLAAKLRFNYFISI